MSRVGKIPVPVPDGTKVEISGNLVKLTGRKGTLEKEMHPDMEIVQEEKEIIVKRPSDLKKHKALHGLTRALLYNMVVGVTEGYTRTLEMVGVGYRAEVKGRGVVLNLGYSHPIMFVPPDGVLVTVEPKENKIFVNGIDKELVGQTAAKIRSLRKPEPYKGKGIRYKGEQVRIKAGKTAGA